MSYRIDQHQEGETNSFNACPLSRGEMRARIYDLLARRSDEYLSETLRRLEEVDSCHQLESREPRLVRG